MFPPAFAALKLIDGTLCTELQTRQKNRSGIWLLSPYYLHKLKSCVCSPLFLMHRSYIKLVMSLISLLSCAVCLDVCPGAKARRVGREVGGKEIMKEFKC